MISEYVFSLVVNAFSGDSEDKRVDVSLKDLTDHEQKFVFTLNVIAASLSCFTYDEPVFTSLNKNAKDSFLVENLKLLLNENIDPLLKGKICDFLWVIHKDISFAKKAFHTYKQIMLTRSDYETQYYLFNRITNIHLTIKDNSFNFDYKALLFKIIEFGRNNNNAMSLNILELAYKEKLLNLDEMIPPTNEKLEQFLNDDNDYVSVMEGAFDLLEKMLFDLYGDNVTSKPAKNKQIVELRDKKVNYYLRLAQSSNERPHSGANYLKSAIKTLKGIDGTEEKRAKLQADLKILQKASLSRMHVFKSQIDVTKQMNYYSAVVDALDGEEATYFFVCGFPIFSCDEMEKGMLAADKGMFFVNFCTEVINDKNGKAIAVLPNWSESRNGDIKKKLPHIEHYSSQRYSHYVNLGMTHVLETIKSKHGISKSVVESIINESMFVPEERKSSFVKGIMAGFDGDYMNAMNLLAPQVENAVRVIAEICGDSVMKINDDNTEEVLSLDSIFELQKINECVREDFLFNLKVIFTSKYGANIRNKIAHGLIDDEDFNNTLCFYAWWFVLRLCFEFSIVSRSILPKLNEKIRPISDKLQPNKCEHEILRN